MSRSESWCQRTFGRPALMGVVLAVLYWGMESVFEALIFKRGDIVSQMFSPTPHETWTRLTVGFLLVAFGVFAQVLLRACRRTEEQFRESEEKYRLLTESQKDAVLSVSPEGRLLYCSPVVKEFGGYDPQEQIGEHISKYIADEEDLKRGQDLLEKVVATGQGDAIEISYRTSDGDSIPVEVTGKPVVKDGTVTEIQCVMRDISERKEAEKRVTHLNAILRAVRNVNQLITRENDREKLVRGICERLVATRGYTDAWVALLDEHGEVKTCAEAADEDDVTLTAELLQQGKLPACGRQALDTGEVVVVETPREQCEVCPVADSYGGQRGMAIRLEFQGHVYGVVGVSSPFVDRKQEKELLRDVAGDIALGLHNIEAEEERRRTEEQLRRSEGKFRRIFEASPDPVFLMDRQGMFVGVNRAAEEKLGYSRDEIVGKTLTNVPFFSDAARELALKRFEDRKIGRKVPPYPLTFRTKEGGDVLAEINAGAFHTDRQFAGAVVIARDITDRKRAEENLRQSEEKYRTLVEHVHDGIYMYAHRTGGLKLANSALCRITGYNEQELYDMDIFDVLHPDDEKKVRDIAERRAGGEEAPRTYEARIRRKDGELRHLHFAVTRISYEDEPIALGAVRDITERKRAERELRNTNQKLRTVLDELHETQNRVIRQERERALTELASGVAHDFNNALSTVRGFTDLLLRSPDKLEERDTVRRYLNMVKTAADNAAKTVRRMRQFYRSVEDENHEPLDVNHVIEEAIAMSEPRWKEQSRAEGAEIRIETDLGDVPQVSGAGSELHEMFTNLILNAVDAMPEGGTLLFRTEEQGGQVLVEVQDTGEGMSEITQKHCMDPFYTTKGDAGTGLGLSTVRGVVSRHEGSISVESEEGGGTTFSIALPVAEEPETEVGEPEKVEMGESLHVLVVEDGETQRELLAQYLRLDDHTLAVASNGREGLEKVREDEFDLVITDRAMPDMSGDEVAGGVKDELPGVPVIMLTGFGDMMEAQDERPANVDLVVSKPVTLEELRQSMAAVMNGGGRE